MSSLLPQNEEDLVSGVLCFWPSAVGGLRDLFMCDRVHPKMPLSRWLIVAGLSALAPCVTTTFLPAGSPKPEIARGVARDLQLTVQARHALSEEPALAESNLGVRVRDGIATISGPLPSAEQIALALKRVESVQGILEVRCDLYVAKPEKKNEPLVIPLVPATPQRTASASPDPESGSLGALSGRTAPASQALPGVGSNEQNGNDSVMPTIFASIPEAPATRWARPVARPTYDSNEQLARDIEKLRRSNPRYRMLRTDINNGTVTVSGTATQDNEVMALAQAIARLGGVDRVIPKTDLNSAP